MGSRHFLKKPVALIQDRRLTPLEQDYLCLIANFEQNGGCIASNNYFAQFFKVKRQTAQGIISRLKLKSFISCTEKKNGGKTIERKIKIIDADSRKALLTNSRNKLPTDSRKSTAGLAGNSDKVSRKPLTLIRHNNKKLNKNESEKSVSGSRKEVGSLQAVAETMTPDEFDKNHILSGLEQRGVVVCEQK